MDQFVDAFFGETARGVDGRSPDWNMGKVENYQRIDAWLEVGSPGERKKYPGMPLLRTVLCFSFFRPNLRVNLRIRGLFLQHILPEIAKTDGFK